MFWGCGSPWAKIVDSRATTGLLLERASETSGRILMRNCDADGNEVNDLKTDKLSSCSRFQLPLILIPLVIRRCRGRHDVC